MANCDVTAQTPNITLCTIINADAQAIYDAQFGEGSDDQRVFLEDVGCSGRELRLIDCVAPPFGSTNCYHDDDAGVVCDTDVSGID